MSEEIEQKEEPQREEIPVPLYFDRYVAGELHSLGNRIVDLKGSMDERFIQVDKQFANLKESMDERFVQFDKRIDERFVQFDKRMDERFVQFDKRIDERFARADERIDNLKESVDKLGANVKWAIGLFSPVIVGILALIVKTFF